MLSGARGSVVQRQYWPVSRGARPRRGGSLCMLRGVRRHRDCAGCAGCSACAVRSGAPLGHVARGRARGQRKSAPRGRGRELRHYRSSAQFRPTETIPQAQFPASRNPCDRRECPHGARGLPPARERHGEPDRQYLDTLTTAGTDPRTGGAAYTFARGAIAVQSYGLTATQTLFNGLQTSSRTRQAEVKSSPPARRCARPSRTCCSAPPLPT